MKDSVKSTAIFYQFVDREEKNKKTNRSTSKLSFQKLDKISYDYIANQRHFQVDRPVVATAK